VKLVVAIAFVSALATAAPATAAASDLSGRVVFNNAAVPGATVTATRGGRTVSTVTDEQGAFRLTGLDDGAWTVTVQMDGFVPAGLDVTIPPSGPSLQITLTLRKYADMLADLVPAAEQASAPDTTPVSAGQDPDIINGSSINGAASVFAQARAFGNNRPNVRALYTGSVSAVLGNSAWNARPYSFGATAGPTPSYGDAQLGFTLGGPLKIPWLVSDGPRTMVAYQHNVNHNATTQSAVMPTAAERAGDFSQFGGVVLDPFTGQPFPGNHIPSSRISPQAAALLAYYPLPNTTGDGANYQTPVLSATTSDNLQLSLTQRLRQRNTVGGTFALARTVTNSNNLFDFADRSRHLSLKAGLTWTRMISARLQLRVRYQFSHGATTTTPFFAGRTDVSGDAGITGNSSAPVDWGPPTLAFPGIAGLSDAQYERSTTLEHAIGAEASLRRGRHNLTFGGDFRRDRDDVSSQPNPRGTLSFTGAMTGNAFADFLLGLPATSAIAFGNTDARLRGSSYDAYITDDLRLSSGLTLNVGMRWEYEAPFTEASGRLVNLDVAPGFTAVDQVLASRPVGPLSGASYPSSLVHPDKRGFEPRLSAAWRPMLASSFVVRASYGLYRNLGVYEPLALLLAQQPPFSETLSVESTPHTPLTLANPFAASLPKTNTFAVDPAFRPGGVQQWQVSVQQDLPASLTVLVSYDGAKGSRLMQASLPNTYPAGAVTTCSSCPSGFVYIASNGDSLRNTLSLTLRRRLHSGLTASVQYTLSKATDDAATFSSLSIAPGSLAVAQNWLDLGAERGPSSFDRRHVVSAQVQYTTGQGVAGGTLWDGPWGALFKDWTITSQLTYGTGLPVTPVWFTPVGGTGIVGVRPSLTGASPAPVTPVSYANAAAYTAPAPGAWGTAGRNSIRGPAEFSLDATLARVFRLRGRLNLEARLAATNLLNRVTFSQIDAVVTSPQFGLPTAANAMRRLNVTFRLGF
jgi:Carboxypeptidase regulatory-like domain